MESAVKKKMLTVVAGGGEEGRFTETEMSTLGGVNMKRKTRSFDTFVEYRKPFYFCYLEGTFGNTNP